MKPPQRNRRLLTVFLILAAAGVGLWLIVSAVLGDNVQFFRNPSDVVARYNIEGDQVYRVGGIVIDGSVTPGEGLDIQFDIRDFDDVENAKSIALPVRYSGVLPDLFREGQGVVAVGTLGADDIFYAETILAKHDENYQPDMPAAYKVADEI